MRNNQHAHNPGPSGIQTFHQSTIFLTDQSIEKKYQHFINVQGEVLQTPHGTTTATTTSK